MCSIAIPSELLLGHSPPVYGSLLYSSLMVTTPPITNRSVPPQIRPCLVQGSLQLASLLKSSNGSDSDAATNKRNKKRVVFADDRGRPLTQVRVMSEPSNMPPLWTSAYVASLASGGIFRNLDGSLASQSIGSLASNNYDKDSFLESANRGESSTKAEKQQQQQQQQQQPWETCFSQPASDYLAFRNKLEQSSVSLENVIVREAEGCLVGTVKVKNIAYDKEVTLRVTYDNWRNFEDVICTYVEQPGLVSQHAVRNLYDTFRFRVNLPPTTAGLAGPGTRNIQAQRQLEFCVRYRAGGQEYWDNNDGANYAVKKKRDVTIEEQVAELLHACCGPDATHNGFAQSRLIKRDELTQPAEEATRVHLRTWSEFASWQHLETDGPYW